MGSGSSISVQTANYMKRSDARLDNLHKKLHECHKAGDLGGAANYNEMVKRERAERKIVLEKVLTAQKGVLIITLLLLYPLFA